MVKKSENKRKRRPNACVKKRRKAPGIVNAHYMLRELILKDRVLKKEHILKVKEKLSKDMKVIFEELYMPIVTSKDVVVKKISKDNVGVFTIKNLGEHVDIPGLRGYDSVKVPNSVNTSLPSYMSTIKRTENNKEFTHYLVGPLAFVNTACKSHATGTTSDFVNASTNFIGPELEEEMSDAIITNEENQSFFKKGIELTLDYRYTNHYCATCIMLLQNKV